MNNEELIDVKTLRPFRRFIYTIGALPSSYLISMTYEEQLLWFCNYLEKTVIPTIDNNGLAVEELQAKYIELKNYVDHYFDNLDIQEEINNKLDDMAESGELTDIIAQYLELAGVLSFNTLNDLINADNVVNGSICLILGKDVYNDEKGCYYKIRTILNTDVIDNDNIIPIENSETLVGEKIINNNELEDFILYAFFDENNDNEINLFISKDNLHLTKIDLPNKIYGRDPSIIYYNNKFYIAITDRDENHDFSIYVSNDLQTWTKHDINVNLYDSSYTRRYAPNFFIDDNNDLYVFISKQYADPDSTNLAGKFKTYITKCTNIDNLSFTNAEEITLTGTTNDNYIDACCIKIDDVYHLLLKNDVTTLVNIDHFTSTDLQTFNLVDSDFGNFGAYCEGQFIYKFNNEYVVGCEKYDEAQGNLSNYRIKTTKDLVNFSNYKTMRYDVDLSHGSAFIVNQPKPKILIYSKNYIFKYENDFSVGDFGNYMITSNTMAHDFPKGRYLKLMSIYPQKNHKAFSIIFKLSDLQRMKFDSLIQIEGKYGDMSTPDLPEYYTAQLTAKNKYDNYKEANLHGKIITLPNTTDKCYDVFFDLNDYNVDLTVMLEIVSKNLYSENIKIYADTYLNQLPTSAGGIRDIKRCLNMFVPFNALYVDNTTNNKLIVKLCMRNGAFKLLGHGITGSLSATYDYTINLLNGNLTAINNNSSLTNSLTFTVDSYTDQLYTISITGLDNYSGFAIELPNVIGSSIIDYTLTSV